MRLSFVHELYVNAKKWMASESNKTLLNLKKTATILLFNKVSDIVSSISNTLSSCLSHQVVCKSAFQML